MDTATWLAVTIALTAVCAVLTWFAFRRRGLPAGMLGAGITLLFPAAYLTDTLRMLTRITAAIADWGTSLVLSPVVWAGIVCGGLGVLLILVSRSMASRGIGAGIGRRGATPAAVSSPRRESLPSAPPAAARGGRAGAAPSSTTTTASPTSRPSCASAGSAESVLPACAQPPPSQHRASSRSSRTALRARTPSLPWMPMTGTLRPSERSIVAHGAPVPRWTARTCSQAYSWRR